MTDMVENTMYLEEDKHRSVCVIENRLCKDFNSTLQDVAVESAGDLDVRKTKVREALKGILIKILNRIEMEEEPRNIRVLEQLIRLVDNIQDAETLPNLLAILRLPPFLVDRTVVLVGLTS
jgi:hypothetical protein